jgi:hypothetical protein
MPVQISHDAFARYSLMRECERTSKTCAYCGNNDHGHLFRYWPESDGSFTRGPSVFHRHLSEKLFCSKPCFEAYNS